jgi:hypothetical protein
MEADGFPVAGGLMRSKMILGGTALAGVLVGAFATSGLRISAEQTTPRQVAVEHSNTARYQIFFSPFARADAYLVDTQTGRVWTKLTFTDLQGDPEAWMYQPRIDSHAEFVSWGATQREKTK